MSYNMNKECKRQELASRLVEREVYYCVSSLISTLSSLAQNMNYEQQRNEGLSWEEDILPLLETTDYEAAVESFVTNDADVSDMEELVEEDGYWGDFLEEKIYPDLGKPPKVPSCCADKLCVECHMALQGAQLEDTSDDVLSCVEAYDQSSVYCGEEYDDEFSGVRCDCCGTLLAGARFTYEDPNNMEDQDLDEWLDADKERNEQFREKVMNFLRDNSDFQELCDKYNIDTDDFHNEVYEHWIVSNWLAAKLSERGHVTGNVCGLTIWGRCCTGQSIALDYSIQELACEVYDTEWKEFLSTLTTSEQSDV